MDRRTAFASAALLLAVAQLIAGCARSFERDVAVPLDAGVDALEPLDLYVPPPPPPVCGEARALPTEPVCETTDPTQFDGCAGALGAVYDGTRCVEVRACDDRPAPFADRYECALSCASLGECNEDVVPFLERTAVCCATCDVLWTDPLDAAGIEALCATIGNVRCGPGVHLGYGESCIGGPHYGPEAVLRGCAWSLVSVEFLECFAWLY